MKDEAIAAVAAAVDLAELDRLRVHYLGKKGALTELLKGLGRLPADERPAAGQAINDAKVAVGDAIDARRGALENSALAARLEAERVDATLPGRRQSQGGLHPVTRAILRIQDIFAQLGFEVAEGPEV
ncbi:MAG: phenylalanine--tRNA ligase subunit alpha, partial [Ectothiorhodospiraceae bacterium]|nr:phenylalanine--tRNA ligase subunit alpha [Ectothiorhodospiraceae bacterium]